MVYGVKPLQVPGYTCDCFQAPPPPLKLSIHSMARCWSVTNARYLGVDISNNMSWNTHVTRVAANGNRSLGFVKRNIKTSISIPSFLWLLSSGMPSQKMLQLLQVLTLSRQQLVSCSLPSPRCIKLVFYVNLFLDPSNPYFLS